MRIISIRFALFIFLTLMVLVCVGRAGIAQTTTLNETPKAVTKVPPNTVATVTAHRLNLRKEASAESRILGILEKGNLLEVTAVLSDWLKVVSPSKKIGWVHRLYVKTDLEVDDKLLASSNEGIKTLKKLAQDNIIEKTLVPDKSENQKKSDEKPTDEPSSDLRKQLESVWNAYREAHRKGDKALYEKNCSAYRCRTLINTLAAVREELEPEDLIFFYDRLPDLATLKFVELKENGPTAGLLYVDEGRKRPDPNLPPPKHFLFIKFIQEAWGWTVDSTHSTSMPKYQIDESETQFDYASLPEELAIDGKVYPAPKALKKLKVRVVKGTLAISSYGYKTKVSINGFPQGSVENTDYSGAVAGGLKKGVNKIDIVITKSDNRTSDLPPNITVHHLSASGEQGEVFKYEPENTVDGQHTLTFTLE